MAKKPDDGMVQSTIRLPSSLFDRLEASNKGRGGRGVSEEIRQRLEASFSHERAVDRLIATYDTTPELADGIFYLSDLVQQCYGDWTKDRFAFEVLKASIEKMLLQKFGTKIEAKADPKPTDMAEILLGDGDHLKSVDDISRVFVAIWLSGQKTRQAEAEKKYGKFPE